MLFKSLALSVFAAAVSAQVSNSSSTESSTMPSATPSFVGSFDGTNPHWVLTVPAAIGAWTGLDVDLDVSAGCSFTGVSTSAGGAPLAGNSSIVDLSGSSLSLSLIASVEEDLVITIDAMAISGNSWTASGVLTITLPDGSKKFVKREVLTYDLDATVVAAAALSTSTEVVVAESTTVVTITSCSDNACETMAVTTGVTVVTETSEGVVTEYTTYCPLSGMSTVVSTSAPTMAITTAAAAEESTTLVTIISCSGGVCTESTSTQTMEVTSTLEAGTSAVVSTFEGKAALLSTSVFGLIFGLLMI